MTNRTIVKAAAVAVLAGALAGCVAYPYGQSGYYASSPYYYDYYYYPQADVYFQLYTGDYYYRSGRAWRRSRTLPSNIYLDRRDRQQLQIRDKTPYARDRDRRSMTRSPSRSYQRNPAYNREERRHNQQRYQDYRQKSRR